MKDIGINGHVKLEFLRKNGDVEIFEYKNKIMSAFLEKIIDALVDDNEDFAMDALMASGDEGNEADGNKDGIALYDSDDEKYYETDCDSEGYGITENAQNIEVVAWTERAGTYTYMALGKGLDLDAAEDYNITGAPVYSVKTINHEIGSGDSLLITWTFNIG